MQQEQPEVSGRVSLIPHTKFEGFWALTRPQRISSLDVLQQRRDERALQPRIQQLKALADRDSPLPQQLAMAADVSREQLGGWRPWALVQTVAGGSLLEPVKGLALAMGPEPSPDNSASRDQAAGHDTLRLRALLHFG